MTKAYTIGARGFHAADAVFHFPEAAASGGIDFR
jgi:hypothetical protein